MSDPRHEKRKQLEQFITNLDYAFNRGVDLDARVIQLTEDIEDHHFDFFDAAMTTLESLNKRTITIKINSYGGDAYTALAIIGRMQESTCLIHTKGYGKIMSASTAILAAGNKRSLSRLAEFMHHEMSYQVEGRHSSIIAEVKQTELLEQKWANLMHELTGTETDFWMRNGIGIDLYLTPDRCLELNIVDRIF